MRGRSVCLFYRHVLQDIDGKALMLLNSEMVIKFMGVKLGPALKIGQLVEQLRGLRRSHC